MPSDAELEGLFGRKPSRVEVAAEVPAAVTVRQLVSPLPISSAPRALAVHCAVSKLALQFIPLAVYYQHS